jgi:hypothetical protein
MRVRLRALQPQQTQIGRMLDRTGQAEGIFGYGYTGKK